jgi:chemotaxis signal transduction protein
VTGPVPQDDLLRLRAACLARPRPVASDQDENRLTVAQFSLGDALYAVPLIDLRAALALRDVTPVPLAPAHVIGVLRWEGRVITAVSLASLLGIRGWRRDPAVLLILACGRGLLAVDSEVIPRLGALSRSAIDAARARREGPTMEIATAGGEVVNLLDVGQAMAMATRGPG